MNTIDLLRSPWISVQPKSEFGIYPENVECLVQLSVTDVQQCGHLTLAEKCFDSHFFLLGLHKGVDFV
jgi:hypothetical protein